MMIVGHAGEDAHNREYRRALLRLVLIRRRLRPALDRTRERRKPVTVHLAALAVIKKVKDAPPLRIAQQLAQAVESGAIRLHHLLHALAPVLVLKDGPQHT